MIDDSLWTRPWKCQSDSDWVLEIVEVVHGRLCLSVLDPEAEDDEVQGDQGRYNCIEYSNDETLDRA